MSKLHAGRVDHVVICVEPHHLEGAARRFEGLLGISFEGPIAVPPLGSTIFTDQGAGIELVAPTDPSIARAQREFLDTHGEGVLRVVFGVADIDAARHRAISMGIDVQPPFDPTDLVPYWRPRFARSLQAHVEPAYGLALSLSETELAHGAGM